MAHDEAHWCVTACNKQKQTNLMRNMWCTKVARATGETPRHANVLVQIFNHFLVFKLSVRNFVLGAGHSRALRRRHSGQSQSVGKTAKLKFCHGWLGLCSTVTVSFSQVKGNQEAICCSFP